MIQNVRRASYPKSILLIPSLQVPGTGHANTIEMHHFMSASDWLSLSSCLGTPHLQGILIPKEREVLL